MLRRLAVIAVLLLILIAAIAYALILYPLHNAHPTVRLAYGTLAIRDATIYPSPDEPALHHADLLIRNGRIAAIGPHLDIPANTQILPCNQCTITAGFWNTHVHFTQPKWSNSAFKPTHTLNSQLADMLTGRGFTTVVDTGSDLRNTVSIRRRIETGDLNGPYIYTAGAAIYPPNGIPYYLRDTLPPYLIHLMPQPDSPAKAALDEQRNIARGADILKLFTGSYTARGQITPMPEPIAAAAVEVAHDRHQLAFAHPSNLEGVLIARDAGVDVLAHAPDSTEGITPAILQSLVDHDMAMIPTLKMFGTTVTQDPAYLNPIYNIVHQFHTLGGQLLFGTDVGYMSDYTTADEFTALTKSGLTYLDILRMLTTAPATRFGVQREKGRVHPEAIADLVILSTDPATDPTAFTKIQTTIRSGRVIYTHP